MKPVRVNSMEKVNKFKTQHTNDYIGYVSFPSEEEAAKYLASYSPKHRSQQSILSDMSVASSKSKVDIPASLQGFIFNKKKRCFLRASLCPSDFSSNIIFLFTLEFKDNRGVWCHKPEPFSIAAQAFATLYYKQNECKFGDHTTKDILNTLRSVALRDKNGGPYDKLKTHNTKNNTSYNVYAVIGLFVAQEQSHSALKIRATQFFDQLKMIVKLENFQKAYHAALGESAVWDKMGGYKSDYWQDFHLATTIIEFCEDIGDCITHDDAEHYRRQQLRYDPKTGLQDME